LNQAHAAFSLSSIVQPCSSPTLILLAKVYGNSIGIAHGSLYPLANSAASSAPTRQRPHPSPFHIPWSLKIRFRSKDIQRSGATAKRWRNPYELRPALAFPNAVWERGSRSSSLSEKLIAVGAKQLLMHKRNGRVRRDS
jgi:hypothetical protein